MRYSRLIVVLCVVWAACGTRTIGQQTTATGGPGEPAEDLHDAEPHHPGDHGEPEVEDVFSTLPPPAEPAAGCITRAL